MNKRTHYGVEETQHEGESNFDGWALCHDIYEANDSKITTDWKSVNCKSCLKKRSKSPTFLIIDQFIEDIKTTEKL